LLDPAASPDGMPVGDGTTAPDTVAIGEAAVGPVVQAASGVVTPMTVRVTEDSSPLAFQITWDASALAAPQAFRDGVIAAAEELEGQYRNAVTVNIRVGYGTIGKQTLPGFALGESAGFLASMSYATYLAATRLGVTSADDASAAASLPDTMPVSGTMLTTTAEAKALGLMSPTRAGTDGLVGFSSAVPFTYDTSGGVPSGSYDFNSVALHELTEVMGRILLTGSSIGSIANAYTPLDMLHFSSVGVRTFTSGAPGYLSVDNGATDIADFNTVSGADAGDWASSMDNDPYNAFGGSGVVDQVSAADLTALDVIGWTRGGVTTAALGASIETAQGAGGLVAGMGFAGISEVGGVAGDSYSYALGGPDAAAFNLSGAGNQAVLAAGSTDVLGEANGAVYALTLTATDTTAGTTTTADPLDIVVGSSGADMINLAGLSGAAGRVTPSFVFGLDGADTIDGTGMSGRLWLDGGAGADSLTGGDNVTDYIYGASSDSTPTSMDVITNFRPGIDAIDLTGLGMALTFVGKLTTRSIGAGDVGWLRNGANTFLYVNTSGTAETLAHADMKIELLGKVAIGNGDIVHL